MRKLIFAALVAVMLPSLSLNANPSILSETGTLTLNNSELSEADEDYSFSSIQRRRRRRRSRLSSPFGISGFLGTMGANDKRTLAFGSEFDYALKNRKKKYKSQLLATLYVSLPIKMEANYSEVNADGNYDEVEATARISAIAFSVTARYFIIGQVTSKFGFVFDMGLGYAFTPYKLEVSQGANTESYSENPSDLVIPVGLGFASNLGKMQMSLTTGLYLPPTQKNGQAYESNIGGWGYAKVSARFPLGR